MKEIVRGEREKGSKDVRVGYKKIKIEKKWYRWNEREEVRGREKRKMRNREREREEGGR